MEAEPVASDGGQLVLVIFVARQSELAHEAFNPGCASLGSC